METVFIVFLFAVLLSLSIPVIGFIVHVICYVREYGLGSDQRRFLAIQKQKQQFEETIEDGVRQTGYVLFHHLKYVQNSPALLAKYSTRLYDPAYTYATPIDDD